MVAAFSCGIYRQLRWLPRSRACSVAYPAMDGLRRGDRRWLPRSPCIPHPFIHSFIHSFISCAFYSRIHCCVRFNSGEAKRFSQHENAQAKSLCHYDILSFIAKSFEFLFRISLPNSQKTSLRFSKFRRPARRTHVILMLKVSHELSENVISIFQVSQTHIHTHTLTC